MQNAAFNEVFETATTTAQVKQQNGAISTTLADGRKITITTANVELGEAQKELSALPKEEQFQAAMEFQEQLVQNTLEADEAEVAQQVEKMAAAPLPATMQYQTPEKWEYSVAEDDSQIEGRTRQTYVWHFKAHQRRTAIASLQMCRVVYEANKSLAEHEFDEFCKNIGYKHDSSTIRKFLVIGKVYPRLIGYADQLPAAWTSIYALTQMPADDFERCIAGGYRLCDLSTGEIDALVKKTRKVNNLMSPFKEDKKAMGYCVAKVFFTKKIDDTDLRLLQKAFDEISARLPVKLVMDKQVLEMHKERALQRYQKLKQEAPDTAIKPGEWDYGTAANSVYVKDTA